VALRAGDRAGAAGAVGAKLDPDWPAPDLLDVLPGTEPFGAWAIVELASSTVVGDIGFHGPPDANGVVEIGYSIVPSRRRRGYAVEAASALIAWAMTQEGVRGIVAGSAPDNAASIATLVRLGFQRAGEANGEARWRSLPRDGS
jgi:RimJ/RimL family protein N-acetyltransferase